MSRRQIKGKKEEDFLIKIANGYINFSEDDEILLKKMISEGLIDKQDAEYKLTPYGEMIRAMGYKVHLRTEKFEKNLPINSPRKKHLITILLGLIFFSVLSLVVLTVYAIDEF